MYQYVLLYLHLGKKRFWIECLVRVQNVAFQVGLPGGMNDRTPDLRGYTVKFQELQWAILMKLQENTQINPIQIVLILVGSFVRLAHIILADQYF